MKAQRSISLLGGSINLNITRRDDSPVSHGNFFVVFCGGKFVSKVRFSSRIYAKAKHDSRCIAELLSQPSVTSFNFVAK